MTNSLTYYPTLDRYHSGEWESPVYNEGSITLITGRTIGYRYFFLNLLVEQLLNNPKAVCLLIEMKKKDKVHTYSTDIHLDFSGLDRDLQKLITSLVEYRLYSTELNTDPVEIKPQARAIVNKWRETKKLIIDYECFTGAGVDNIAQNIEQQKLRYDVTHVFIDNINGIKDDDFKRFNYDNFRLHTFPAETINKELCMATKKT